MRRVTVTDVAAALVLATFMVVVSQLVRTTQPHARSMTVVGVVLLLVCGGALALHRAAPLVAYAGAVGAAVGYLALRMPGWPVYLGAFAGLIALVSAGRGRRWVVPAAVGGAGLAVATGPPEDWNVLRMLTIAVVWAAVAVLADRLATVRERLAAADTARQVAEERLRIAQELHDVLSHSLAAISLRAGVGLHLVDRQPSSVREALASIRQLSNDALGRAREALAAVRDPSAAPGLADLAGLIESFRADGMAVDYDLDPDLPGIPSPTGTVAYRVVQEALTNVMRHAGPEVRVAATVRRDGQCLVVEVRDNGRPVGRPAPPGHGLRGLTERVRGLGGTCSAGFEDGAGFVVSARLPLSSAP